MKAERLIEAGNEKKTLLTVSLSLFLFVILFVLYYNKALNFVTSEFLDAAIFLLILLFFTNLSRISPTIKFFVIISFMIKALYSYQIYSTIVSPFSDSFLYLEGLNTLIANQGIDFQTALSTANSLQFGFYYLMYFTYTATNSLFSIYLMNILLACLSILLFNKVIQKDFGKKIADATTIFCIFSTNILLFTSNILKDSFALFLFMLCIYLYKKIETSKLKALLLVSVAVALSLLLTVRIYVAISFVLSVSIDYLLNHWKATSTWNKAFILASFVILTLVATPWATGYLVLSQAFVQEYSLTDYLTKTPLGFLKIVFSPLPWRFLNASSIYEITAFDSILLILMAPLLVNFFIKLCKFGELRKKAYFYVTPILVHAFTLGLAYDGQSTRQRTAIFFLVWLLFMIGAFYKATETRKQDA